jgi:hypothetical protein
MILFTPAGKAGDSIFAPSQADIALSDIQVREPDSTFFNTYRKSKDYAYISDYKPGKSSGLLDRLWRFIVGIVKKGMNAFQYLPIVFRVILLLLFILLIYVVFTKTKFYRLFYTDKEIPLPDFDEIDILDEEYDFEKAINAQLAQQNFRNAIRLLHLKILKELEAHELIRYSKDKTNRDYSREIRDNGLRNSFLTLTGVYNRVWYGNYPLLRGEYGTMAAGFYQFSERIYAGKE